MIDTNAIGSFLLHLAIVVAAFSTFASVVGRRRDDGRLLIAGERAGYALCGILVCASLLLVNAFLSHDYANKYVARYSDNNMPWYYLVSAFWGGQAGSLMFWSLVLGVCTAIVIRQNREKNRDILPTVIATLMVMQAFFLVLMVIEANPFERFAINEPPINGRGLEPLLQNPAMTFHPPSILSGYVWFTVPFAFAVAALIHRRRDDAWIKTTRGYAVISWGFLSIGNLFGGMWAYQELGWGGFWGWDPVENASFMPWIAATAYLHSVMIQERRGLLRTWNFFLVLFTYFLTVFGTFLTRSGLIDSVHTFAQSDVGAYFVVALLILTIAPLMMLTWRVLDGTLRAGQSPDHPDDPYLAFFRGPGLWKGVALSAICANAGLLIVLATIKVFGTTGFIPTDLFVPVLASLGAWIVGPIAAVVIRWVWDRKAKIVEDGGVDSLLSREGIFLLNNLLLFGLVWVVMFGTIGGKISEFFWQKTKYTAPWFNAWMVPGGLALLLLMGVGPLVPWRKMTTKSFFKNFIVPMVVATAATAAIWFGDVYHLRQHLANTDIPFGEVPAGRLPLVAELTGVYALLGFWGVFFVLYTMVLEFLRGARVRAKSTGEGYFRAMGRLAIKQKRRYGGYITHIGFAGLFLGFIGTGLKTEKDLTFNTIGEVHTLEDKQLEFLGFEQTENREYSEWFAKFAVYQVDEGVRGEKIGELWPSRRAYHGANVQMSRNTSEKDELFLWKGNVYATLIAFRPNFNQAEIMAHYNPMILHMWIGGAFLLFGVFVTLWPEPAPYPVFAAARRGRRRRDVPDGAPEAAPLARARLD